MLLRYEEMKTLAVGINLKKRRIKKTTINLIMRISIVVTKIKGNV
jgi:hypothetical protein